MVKARGYIRYKNFSVVIDGDKVQCDEVGGERYFLGQILFPENYTYICNGHVRYRVMIFYPYTFITAIHEYYYDVSIKPKDEDIEFSNLISDFIDGIIIRSSNDFLYRKEGTELEFVIMVIAVSCVKLLSAHNSTQHTSRKHKV
jgi:hypothetical protein